MKCKKKAEAGGRFLLAAFIKKLKESCQLFAAGMIIQTNRAGLYLCVPRIGLHRPWNDQQAKSADIADPSTRNARTFFRAAADQFHESLRAGDG